MANKKISQLTSATVPLSGSEELPIVQGGSTVKATAQNIADLASGGPFELGSGINSIQPMQSSNNASGNYATIGGGYLNTASGDCSFVGSGFNNSAVGPQSTVNNGKNNVAGKSPYFLPVNDNCIVFARFYLTNTGYVGGFVDYISADRQTWCMPGDETYAFTGASSVCKICLAGTAYTSQFTIVPTNSYCVTSVTYDSLAAKTCVTLNPTLNEVILAKEYGCNVVVAGNGNQSLGQNAFVGSGYNNVASGDFSFIGNGFSSGNYGKFNNASGTHSFIGNGVNNTASGFESFVGNGYNNRATGGISFATGYANYVSGYYSSIVGGASNTLTGRVSFIGAGSGNRNTAYFGAAIVAGSGNCVNANSSSVVAGKDNCVYSSCSSILGGIQNVIPAVNNESFILGSCITADRSCATFVNNLSIMNIPTSPVGLPAGSIWKNGAVLNIV